MSIRAGIAAFLVTLNKTPYVYHGELPENPRYPATVYDVISDVPIGHTHDNLVIGFRRARVQIDVFAESVADAETAMESYVAAMAGFKGSLGAATGYTDVSIFDLGANPDLEYEAEPVLRALEARSRDFMILY